MAFLGWPSSSLAPDPAADTRGDDAAPLGSVAELARRKRTVVRVGDFELLVVFAGKRFTVVENRCPHAGARLDDARVTRRSITCARHSYRYAFEDGACVSAPCNRSGQAGRLRKVPTLEVDGCLYAAVGQIYRAG